MHPSQPLVQARGMAAAALFTVVRLLTAGALRDGFNLTVSPLRLLGGPPDSRSDNAMDWQVVDDAMRRPRWRDTNLVAGFASSSDRGQ